MFLHADTHLAPDWVGAAAIHRAEHPNLAHVFHQQQLPAQQIEPRAGAVLVWAKTRRLRLGHLAVVRRIVNERTIIVDHANWLNRGRIHLGTAVRDVSPKNDWSKVRVWYTPGSRLGSGTYATQGFIYAKPSKGRIRGPRSLPIPQRRPIPALAKRSIASIAPGPRKPEAVFLGSKGADPSIRPAIPKPALKQPIKRLPDRDTWYLDSRRG